MATTLVVTAGDSRDAPGILFHFSISEIEQVAMGGGQIGAARWWTGEGGGGEHSAREEGFLLPPQ